MLFVVDFRAPEVVRKRASFMLHPGGRAAGRRGNISVRPISTQSPVILFSLRVPRILLDFGVLGDTHCVWGDCAAVGGFLRGDSVFDNSG